ncbi:uncharacterized protein N7477_003650 [Penicillium maclennaniae]|uniref:uncharacterized protein n=1 Tax=Penicillium maclennaniae TaxID=1343394 RepID=UPI00253FD486|nr:uncharacterized protein N7477_003650 [Penicillium maclennaniae]KAJ5678017.1 hypothetical protein N7477_003650 [Penicillium maclennaniae]
MSGEKILEGVFAVHKPQGVTSADVLRTLQKHFNPSKTFKPWLDEEKARRDRESQFQKKRRRHPKRCEVKLGHGGTLDPLATGVLVAGVGKGTKSLQDFLGCTKSYETIVLFGAETDSYDRLGKIVRRAPSCNDPPIFSALRVEGKKLYEYAREGKLPPVEIKERPVEVISMDIVEWYEPGTHDFKWPEEEMTGDAKIVAEKLLDKESALSTASEGETAKQESSNKRKSPPAADTTEDDQEAGKKQKVSEDGAAQTVSTETAVPEPATKEAPTTEAEQPKPQPAAVKISMTVTSGFYVRSLAHDLGKAVGSCGLMSELVRSRQADFVLDSDKILEYKDLEAGEEVWGPKVRKFLEDWEAKRAAKAEAEGQQ